MYENTYPVEWGYLEKDASGNTERGAYMKRLALERRERRANTNELKGRHLDIAHEKALKAGTDTYKATQDSNLATNVYDSAANKSYSEERDRYDRVTKALKDSLNDPNSYYKNKEKVTLKGESTPSTNEASNSESNSTSGGLMNWMRKNPIYTGMAGTALAAGAYKLLKSNDDDKRRYDDTTSY